MEEKEKCPGFSGSALAKFFGEDCENEAAELHPCPFREEIYDDDEFTCRCCDDCTHECAMDI